MKQLGRVKVAFAFDHGRFRATVYENGKQSVAPRFGAHLRADKATATLPASTSWLQQCLDSIKQTYGNTQAGDCVIASMLHIIGGWTGNESGSAALSSDTEALSTYHAMCGAGDNGCVITDVLDQVKSGGMLVGGTPHKIDGYAALDNANQNEVMVCIEVFGPAAKLGINLPQAWMDAATASGFTWDDTTSQSIGGHDVPIIDYTPQGVVIATWGMWGTITWKALANKSIVEEAWITLGPDWYAKDNLAPNGIAATTLLNDLALVNGGSVPPLPAPTPPVPPPNPPPTPTPTPIPVTKPLFTGTLNGSLPANRQSRIALMPKVLIPTGSEVAIYAPGSLPQAQRPDVLILP